MDLLQTPCNLEPQTILVKIYWQSLIFAICEIPCIVRINLFNAWTSRREFRDGVYHRTRRHVEQNLRVHCPTGKACEHENPCFLMGSRSVLFHQKRSHAVYASHRKWIDADLRPFDRKWRHLLLTRQFPSFLAIDALFHL